MFTNDELRILQPVQHGICDIPKIIERLVWIDTPFGWSVFLEEIIVKTLIAYFTESQDTCHDVFITCIRITFCFCNDDFRNLLLRQIEIQSFICQKLQKEPKRMYMEARRNIDSPALRVHRRILEFKNLIRQYTDR